jgi:hypothetical protein
MESTQATQEPFVVSRIPASTESELPGNQLLSAVIAETAAE